MIQVPHRPHLNTDPSHGQRTCAGTAKNSYRDCKRVREEEWRAPLDVGRASDDPIEREQRTARSLGSVWGRLPCQRRPGEIERASGFCFCTGHGRYGRGRPEMGCPRSRSRVAGARRSSSGFRQARQRMCCVVLLSSPLSFVIGPAGSVRPQLLPLQLLLAR